MFHFEDLHVEVSPDSYTVEWTASKFYTNSEQNQLPCYINEKLYDKVIAVMTADASLKFPGFEGWGCSNVGDFLDQVAKSGLPVNLKDGKLGENIK